MQPSESAPLDGIRQAFHRLDRMLESAVVRMEAMYGAQPNADRIPGLHVTLEEVERDLSRAPMSSTFQTGRGAGSPAAQAGPASPPVAGRQIWTPWRRRAAASSPSPAKPQAEEMPPTSARQEQLLIPSNLGPWSEDEELLPDWLASSTPLGALAHEYQLERFDLETLLIALAPELDLRYERVFAYLQDNVTRKRPTVDLVLDLLCKTVEERLAKRTRFSPEAPLIRSNLIQLMPDPHAVQPPLLSRLIRVDEQIVDVLLGQDGLDSRLAGFCKLTRPSISIDALSFDGELQALAALVQDARQMDRPLRIYFRGPHGAGKKLAAQAVAGEAGVNFLLVDLPQAAAEEKDFERALDVALREARYQDALLYLDGLDGLRSFEGAAYFKQLLEKVTRYPGVVFLAGSQPWEPPDEGPLGVLVIQFNFPTFQERRAIWQASLAEVGIVLDTSDLETLAGRFRLTNVQIANAVATSWNERMLYLAAHGKVTEEPVLGVKDLLAAARDQSGYELATLTRKITPLYTWDDIVLPTDILTQLREIGLRVAHRQTVMEAWGFDRKLSHGKGVSALFAGTSGTGKTMAAEIIANELDLDLYVIDLSMVVSKYIGETERNLERIFTSAENANAILCINESEALLGKRSEVRDAHDRYANIEVAYLLQKMEQYEGLVILTTNLRQNMDEAFFRRIQFIVEFPFPDEASRQRIFQVLFPRQAPLDPSIDFAFLARAARLSGGNIKNIVLHAAFLAASQAAPIRMAHLLQATAREYKKAGKVFTDADLGPYRDLVHQ